MGKIEKLIMVPEALTHLTGANNYTWVHFWNGEKQMVASTLKQFELSLPTFWRIHKMHLINPAYVSHCQPPPVARQSGLLILQNGLQLPISRRRWPDLVQFFPEVVAN